jgi:hypothetical protein
MDRPKFVLLSAEVSEIPFGPDRTDFVAGSYTSSQGGVVTGAPLHGGVKSIVGKSIPCISSIENKVRFGVTTGVFANPLPTGII